MKFVAGSLLRIASLQQRAGSGFPPAPHRVGERLIT